MAEKIPSNIKENTIEVKGGIKAEKHIGEFLELQETFIEKIELTKKEGINDRNQVDAFIILKGDAGLLAALDFTDPEEERLDKKQGRQKLMSFICRHDEKTEKPISEVMPHFIIDGINITKWIEWGTQADEEGIPITDVMTQKQQEEQFRFIIGKMWEQVIEISRKGADDQKRKIRPYKIRLEKEYKRILSGKELELMGIA